MSRCAKRVSINQLQKIKKRKESHVLVPEKRGRKGVKFRKAGGAATGNGIRCRGTLNDRPGSRKKLNLQGGNQTERGGKREGSMDKRLGLGGGGCVWRLQFRGVIKSNFLVRVRIVGSGIRSLHEGACNPNDSHTPDRKRSKN